MWLGVLGPLQVRDDGATIRVAAAKQRVVLAALLAQANRVVSFDDLARTVWDCAPPPAAKVTLRNYVKRLRQGLGPDIGGRIHTCSPGYMIEVAGGELDVLGFARLCGAGGAAVRAGQWAHGQDALEQALQLWRGSPLADVPSEVLRSQELPRLEQLRLQALEWHTEAGLHLGRHGELVADLRALADAHPLRERFRAQLMLALYRCGRQAEALASYQEARRMLIDELGVEPGPELRQLQQGILAADPRLWDFSLASAAAAAADRAGTGARDAMMASHLSGGEDRSAGRPAVTQPGPGPVRPRQLPSSVRNFAGRAAELKELSGLLDHPAGAQSMVVISAIGGCAGVGKTALAVHWAHQVAERFADGQLYVNLRGHDPALAPVAPAEAIAGFLSALNVPRASVPAGLAEQAALYRSVLADRSMLIVLDNARDDAQVRPLLPGSTGCMVVVTSRSQLMGLIVTEGARPLAVGLLTEQEAAELLAGRLGQDKLAAEPDAARELVRMCARLPLALSVAAARAAASPQAPLAALVTELSTTGRLLDGLACDDPLASVRTVLSWSYDRLSASAARMFRLLGIHPGPDISVSAAASLAGVALAEARRALDELSGAQSVQERTADRFALHDLLRDLAAEKAERLDSAVQRRAALHRVLDHYLHTAQCAEQLLYPGRDPVALAAAQAGTSPERLADPAGALAWLEAERQVLVAVTRLAAETGFEAYGEKISWLLGIYLQRQGYWHDWAVAQQIALCAAERIGDEAGVARSHRAIGARCILTGGYQDAQEHLDVALEMERSLGNRQAQAAVHLSMARSLDRQGRYGESLSHARQAAELCRALGQRIGQAAALNAVGWCHSRLEQHAEALDCCRQAVALHHELGDRHGEAAARDSLGHAYHSLGQHHEAVSCFRQALELLADLGDRHHQALALTGLGDAYAGMRDADAAGDAWRQASAILTELQHPDATGIQARLAQARPVS